MIAQHRRNLRQREQQRLQAAIDEQNAASAMQASERALLAQAAQKAREAEAFNREVAAIVGRTAIIAGAPVHQMFDMLSREDAREHGIRAVPAPRPTLASFAFDNRPLTDYSMETIRYEVLRMLDFDVVAEPMRRCMHMKVQLAGEEVRYAISDFALYSMPREKLTDIITRELVPALMNALLRKRGR